MVLEDIGVDLGSYASQAFIWLFVLMIIAVGIGGLIIFIGLKSYKYKVIIRDVISNRVVIIEDRAKEFTDERGVVWWKLLKEKNKVKRRMPAPPSETIDISKKGTMVHETYRIGETYIPIRDGKRVAEIPSDLFLQIPKEIEEIEDFESRWKRTKEWKVKRLNEWKAEMGISEAFQPLTSQQRALQVTNISNAQEKKGTSWTTHIPMIVGIGAAVILVIALIVFWGDIAQPVIDSNKERTIQMELQKEQLEILKSIKNELQIIEPEGNEGGKSPPR